MNFKRLQGSVVLVLVLMFCQPLIWPTVAQADRPGKTIGYADLCRRMTDLQRLATLPTPGTRTAQFSSWNRASRYDPDTDSYPEWHENGDDRGVLRTDSGRDVLAEMDGPGVIWRVWSAQPLVGNWNVYLDGQAAPAIRQPFKDFFASWLSVDLPNMIYVAAKGRNLYLPIPFQERARMEGEPGWGYFYHITWQQFPPGTKLPTFSLPLPPEDREALRQANAALSRLGHSPPQTGPNRQTRTVTRQIPPGQTVELFDLQGPRAITALRVGLKGANLEEYALRELALVVRWDGQDAPAIWCPLGDFFGTGPGRNEYRSLPMGVTDEQMYSFWYMPFRSAKIALSNDGPTPRTVTFEVTTADLTAPIETCGRFHAKWHRDTGRDPKRPLDWPILKTQGRGRFVGVMLHVWNPAGGWWGEGDERIFVDGEKFPSFFGTGTEDYFGYAWGDPELFHRPYHNQTLSSGNMGNVSLNRWHIVDDVPFQKSIEVSIEKYQPPDPAERKGLSARQVRHARKSKQYTTYAAVAYFYLAEGQHDPYRPVPVERRLDYYDTSVEWKIAKYLMPPAVEIPDQTNTVPLTIPMQNFLNSPAKVTLTWDVPDRSGWKIEPTTRTMELQARASKTIDFHATIDPSSACPVPKGRFEINQNGTIRRGSATLRIRPRTLRASLTSQAPTLDGNITEPAWQQAEVYRGFVPIGKAGQQANPDTEIRALWDSNALYIAVTCLEPRTDALRQNVTQRDGLVFADDSVELFLSPRPGNQYAQFMVNSIGVGLDNSNLFDPSINNWAMNAWKRWDGQWTVAAEVQPDRWTAEFRIPLATIGVKQAKRGDRLRINVCRNRWLDTTAPSAQSSSFTPLPYFFHQPECFGTLILSVSPAP